MLNLSGKQAEIYVESFSTIKLDFDWIVYKIFRIYKDNCSIGIKFIAKRENTDDYYLAEWTVGGMFGNQVYIFRKINFNLYISYLKGDISYFKFKFESLKIDDVVYHVYMNKSQFHTVGRFSKVKRLFFEGNKIEYDKVLVIDFDNMPSWFMSIPYEYKNEYEPLGYICEVDKWDDNVYKKLNSMNNELLSFIRELKIKELLD